MPGLTMSRSMTMSISCFLFLSRTNLLAQIHQVPVDDDPDKAVFPELGELFPVFPLRPRTMGERRVMRVPSGIAMIWVHHLGDGLRGYFPAAVVAGRTPHPGEEEAQVVVDLRHRPDRRAGVLAGRLLLD